MPQKENKISITGDGNIIIQDAQTGNITINQNDPQVFEKLKKLNDTQIALLQQILNEQTDKFSDLLKTIISGMASQKNIVKDSTINAKSVKIGDTIEYSYKISNQNAEKIYNINKIDNANFS